MGIILTCIVSAGIGFLAAQHIGALFKIADQLERIADVMENSGDE